MSEPSDPHEIIVGVKQRFGERSRTIEQPDIRAFLPHPESPRILAAVLSCRED